MVDRVVGRLPDVAPQVGRRLEPGVREALEMRARSHRVRLARDREDVADADDLDRVRRARPARRAHLERALAGPARANQPLEAAVPVAAGPRVEPLPAPLAPAGQERAHPSRAGPVYRDLRAAVAVALMHLVGNRRDDLELGVAASPAPRAPAAPTLGQSLRPRAGEGTRGVPVREVGAAATRPFARGRRCPVEGAGPRVRGEGARREEQPECRGERRAARSSRGRSRGCRR